MNYFKNLLDLHNGEQDKRKVLEDVYGNISFRGANLWILACAILIASIGLNMNSSAVVIGAMLISPLMGPILGVGFGVATYDLVLLKKSAKNLMLATIVSLIASSVYFYISPFKEVQSELLSRTSPTIYDVLIAFFGGIVGAVSVTRVEKGNPIPGVAIATALMPPLCTAGYGLATFNLKFLAGALYLYSINCFFIGIATLLIAKYLKYPVVVSENKTFDKRLKTAIYTLLLLMILPSSYLAYDLINERKFIQNVELFLRHEFSDSDYTIIYKNIDYNKSPRTIELAFLSKNFDSIEIEKMNRDLRNYGIKDTRLVIKQSTYDIKSEILSEISKSNSSVSQKDLQLNALKNELEDYKKFDLRLANEIKILYPEIKELYMGKVSNLSDNDTVTKNVIIYYKSTQPVDQKRLTNWIGAKLGEENIKIIPQPIEVKKAKDSVAL